MLEPLPECAECDEPFVPFLGQGPAGEGARFCNNCRSWRQQNLMSDRLWYRDPEPCAGLIVAPATQEFARRNCVLAGGHEDQQETEEPDELERFDGR